MEDIKKAKDGLDVWPDLLRYARTGFATITPDDMTRFRWYGIYEQQPKDDQRHSGRRSGHGWGPA